MNNNEEEKLLTPEEQMLRDTVLRLSCLRMQEQAGECLKKGHRDACRRGGRHCFLAFALQAPSLANRVAQLHDGTPAALMFSQRKGKQLVRTS